MYLKSLYQVLNAGRTRADYGTGIEDCSTLYRGVGWCYAIYQWPRDVTQIGNYRHLHGKAHLRRMQAISRQSTLQLKWSSRIGAGYSGWQCKQERSLFDLLTFQQSTNKGGRCFYPDFIVVIWLVNVIEALSNQSGLYCRQINTIFRHTGNNRRQSRGTSMDLHML